MILLPDIVADPARPGQRLGDLEGVAGRGLSALPAEDKYQGNHGNGTSSGSDDDTDLGASRQARSGGGGGA